MANREALSKREKIRLFVTSTFIIVIGVVGYGFYSINVNPVVNIPTPAMPEPNALDIYLAALQLKVPSIATPARPYPNLTLDDVRECIIAGKIGPNPKREAGSVAPKLADMRVLMAKNAPMLAKVREGFTAEYREIPMRSFNQSFSHCSKMRDLTRAMLADGKVKCAGGDWDGGAESFLDAIRLGNDSARGGVLISMLVGVALQAIGRSEVWDTLDHVSGAEARHAARRLEEMAARQVPYTDVLREEKLCVQASLLEEFKDPNWSKLSDPKFMKVSRIEMLEWRLTSKRRIMRNYTQYIDALIENSKKPYPANLKSLPTPEDLLNRIISPVYGDGKAWMKYAVNQTQNDLLTLSFTLRAYNVDHGKYPAELKALTPDYLKDIPADIFTAGKPLSYQVTGKSYVLYSVGPDGKDGGGAPSADGIDARLSTPGTKNTYLTVNSVGDIVAGVNVH